MKRILAAVALCLSLCLLLSVTSFAAEISKVNPDLPNIEVELNGVTQKIDPAKVTATLDGQPLTVAKAGNNSGSTEWIVMLDTSQSVRQAYFNATKKALKSLYDAKGENETIKLYYFDSEIKQVLNGSESKDEAFKKIDGIAYVGQETVFYDTLGKLSELCKESKADTVIPVIFTDGVDTKSASSKEDGQKALAAMPDTFRAFYPDNLSAKDKSNFTELMKNAKGKTVAYGTDNIDKKFDDIKKKVTGSAALTLTADGPVTANEKAALSIDLGDGKPITAAASVPDWAPEPETTEPVEPTTEPTTEPVTGDNNDEKTTSPLIFVIIAVVVLLIAALLFFLMKNKKKGDNGEKPKKEKKAREPKEKKEKEPKSDKEKKEKENKLEKERNARAGERAAKERDRVIQEHQKEQEKAKKEQEKASEKVAKDAAREAALKEKQDAKKKNDINLVMPKEGKDDSKAAAKAAKERERITKERRKADEKAKKEQAKADAKAAKEADALQKKEIKKLNKEKDKNAITLAVPSDKKPSAAELKSSKKAALERQKAAERLAAEKKNAEGKAEKAADKASKKAEPSKRELKARKKEEQQFKFYFQDGDKK